MTRKNDSEEAARSRGQFGPTYAGAYDRLYEDKDYEAECDLIEHVVRTYGERPVSSILDLGCGTGNHAIPLGRRGFEVVGVDRSPWMIAEAERKIAASPDAPRVTVVQADIRHVALDRQFDAALMMFAVLGYQMADRDVLAALSSARRHLTVGGLLLFDVWFGPAVVHERPSPRLKVVPTPEGEIRRTSSARLDLEHHLATVDFHVTQGDAAAPRVLTDETHRMRYFFPEELAGFLTRSAFGLVRVGAFPEFDRAPDETTWNVLVLARAM